VGTHRRAQLPGDNVTRVVIEDGGEVVPAPADHLEIGEVGLPELVGRRRLVLELVGGLDDDEGWAADQVMGVQWSVDLWFGVGVAVGVREPVRQLSWAELWLLNRPHVNSLPDVVGNAVPDAI